MRQFYNTIICNYLQCESVAKHCTPSPCNSSEHFCAPKSVGKKIAKSTFLKIIFPILTIDLRLYTPVLRTLFCAEKCPPGVRVEALCLLNGSGKKRKRELVNSGTREFGTAEEATVAG